MTMSNLAYDASVDGGDTSQQDIAAMQALRPIPRISIQAFCETEGVANPVERAGEDRGANVVETIIIVAGFAILAAGIYTAVSGKVQTWIAKMP